MSEPGRPWRNLHSYLPFLEHVQRMRNTGPMSKMLQVRNIPDRLHREVTKRAKARGQSLTEYVQGLLEREVARPPAERSSIGSRQGPQSR